MSVHDSQLPADANDAAPAARAEPSEAPGAAPPFGDAAQGRGEPEHARPELASRRRRTPAWLATVLSNAPLLLLLLLVPAAKWLEGPLKVDDPADLRNGVLNVDPTRLQLLLLIGVNITLAVSLHLINGISGQFSLGHAGFMAIGAYMAAYATITYSNNFTASPGVLLYFVALFATAAVAALGVTVLFLIVRSTARVARSLPGLLVLLLFVWVIVDMILSSKSLAPAGELTLAGRTIHLAYHPVWPGLFGLLTGLFTTILSDGGKPVTFLLVLLGGGFAAALAGLVVGLPTLRLRGDYLAIVTLGFAIIIQNLISLSPALGAARGLVGIPLYNDWVDAPDQSGNLIRSGLVFPWVYGTAIVATFVVWRLTRSPIGRSILATREDEVAAASIGVNTTRAKVTAFVVGAFFAGVAGALHAHFYSGSIEPKNYGWTVSVDFVVIVTLGGLGNLWGAIIAAIVLTFLPEFLRQPQFWTDWALAALPGRTAPQTTGSPAPPPAALKWMADNRMVVYALLLIVVMLLKSRDWSVLMPRWRKKVGTSS
ncbi:MAG TPA: branched-chain amino acid ABC transporter permease [Tepidisphaeraceae bacterium]|nr:branched-chain amino acid ABC transporter permease [Tepidisphaeraceae bacterium]